MSKQPARVPIGGLAGKLTRSFTAPQTVNTDDGATVTPENVQPRSTESGEAVETPAPEQSTQAQHVGDPPSSAPPVIPVSPQAVVTAPPPAVITVPPQPASPVIPPPVYPVPPFTATTVAPLVGLTVVPQTGNPEGRRKKKTSLELPWDVKTRLALWRAQLREEGLPATESGIIVALARAATIEAVRTLLTPQTVEEDLPHTGER